MPVNQKKKRRKKKKAKLGCWRDVDWPGSIEDLRFVYQREKSGGYLLVAIFKGGFER